MGKITDTCLQPIRAAVVTVLDVKVAEREYDFAETWRHDFVLLVLAIVVVLRIVRRADRTAGSFENFYFLVST